MSTEIIPSMRDTIFNGFEDIVINNGEFLFDCLLDDGVFKEIPIFNTVWGLCKTGLNIRERHFLKETYCFVRAFNNGTINPEKLLKYREELISNPQKEEKEIERIILLLNAHLNSEQSVRLGCIYRNYVQGSISWQKFVELSEANSRLFEADYNLLLGLPNEPIQREDYMLDRLTGLGLTRRLSPSIAGNTLEMNKNYYVVSPFGKTFIQSLK